MESCEVIIVGGGPAGLSAAKKLSESGKQVLLLEKNKTIGPKVCAGGIPSVAVKEFNLPTELLDLETKEMTFHTPLQNKTFILGDFFYTVDRKNLGAWQLSKLKGSSISIRTSSAVTKIEKDCVVVNGSERIGYKYLVGADGANSIVRKYAGLKTENFSIAVQYVIPTDRFKNVEIFFDHSAIKLGYVWIFPHRNYVSIGCGTEPRYYSTKKITEGFGRWLKKYHIDISRARFEAFSINYDYRGCEFGNVYLAGDAAGMAGGLTGGGIYQALVSGEEIAKKIIDPTYISKRMEKILGENEKQNKMLRFLERTRPILSIEMELFMLIIKNKWIGDKFLQKIM